MLLSLPPPLVLVVHHISCCRWGCCCCCFFLGRICVHSYISARSHSLAVVVVWLESLTISDIMLCSMFYHTIYFDRGSFYCIIHILFYPLALLGLSCLLVLSPLPPQPHILLCARALGLAGWLTLGLIWSEKFWILLLLYFGCNNFHRMAFRSLGWMGNT